ncbi:hypothetical protein P4S63_19575 [Pseudoalteromonas sp. B193]
MKLVSSNNGFNWQIDDSGAGMTEEQKERIFNRFYRVGGDQHHDQARCRFRWRLFNT